MLKWQVASLDGLKLLEPESLHAELKFKLQLPDWYGGNMDALLDILSVLDDRNANSSRSLQLGQGENAVLRISNSNVMLREAAGLFVELSEVVAAANERYVEAGSGTRLLIELV